MAQLLYIKRTRFQSGLRKYLQYCAWEGDNAMWIVLCHVDNNNTTNSTNSINVFMQMPEWVRYKGIEMVVPKGHATGKVDHHRLLHLTIPGFTNIAVFRVVSENKLR